MSSLVGPTGRAHRRTPHAGKWIAATIVCVVVIGVAIVGVPNVAGALRYFGF